MLPVNQMPGGGDASTGMMRPCATDDDCAGLDAGFCHHQDAQEADPDADPPVRKTPLLKPFVY
jgi:hypothetical protein